MIDVKVQSRPAKKFHDSSGSRLRRKRNPLRAVAGSANAQLACGCWIEVIEREPPIDPCDRKKPFLRIFDLGRFDALVGISSDHSAAELPDEFPRQGLT